MIQIFESSIGPYQDEADVYLHEPIPKNKDAWTSIRGTIRRELGRQTLVALTQTQRIAIRDNAQKECAAFLKSEENVDHWLDLVEFAARYIDKTCRRYSLKERKSRGITQNSNDALEELNLRFKQALVGYRYEGGQIIRIDNQLIHAEVTKPALQLLADSRFKGPQQEFLEAHKHHRSGNTEDCITNALKAFESTLKTICALRGWDHQSRDRASDLIKIIRTQILLPDYLDNSFDQLIATLKFGLPMVRNKAGGHGQGPKPRATPDYLAAYALHLAAANIVLLALIIHDVYRI